MFFLNNRIYGFVLLLLLCDYGYYIVVGVGCLGIEYYVVMGIGFFVDIDDIGFYR